ncbi:MAG: 2-oxo acid dehydrogenase subunit E2 [Deltaproteobacteria bacterium]|nr:2-oxo acid dehydrogenase subunit E2 [Deltaproteobacteria bacterium]
MAEFFKMPQASPTMESGTLNAWRKAEGDALVSQDVVAEVETDKAAMDVEVFEAGFLLKILAQAGEDVPAGRPIAIIGKSKDEDISALLAEFAAMKGGAAPAAAQAAPVAAPAAAQAAAPVVVAELPPKATANPGVVPPAAPAPATVSTPGGYVGPTWRGKPLHHGLEEIGGTFTPAKLRRAVRSSPLARKIAEDLGVPLDRVAGSGPNGRVLRADVEAAAQAPAPQAAQAAAPARANELVRNSKMRKLIASRLKESYLDAPTFFLTANFDCDALVAFRTTLNQQASAKGVKVSFNDLTLLAVARALAEVPECNAAWGEESITRFGSVDLGVAVALEDGLITPIIRGADKLSLLQLAAQTKALVERARARKLQPEEYTGATFSVSNLGMMGIEHFTAILNPPAAGILAVGALQQEPVVKDGALGVGWRMRVTMTCDHRVIDGALGARFLAALRQLIERPLLLVV